MLSDSELRAATQCIALRARRFSRLVSRHYDHALREAGLTAAQFSLMGAIALKQPVSPASLSRMLDLEKSSLSRNLRLLIASRFVISEGPREGGQSLSVTAKGRAVLQQAMPAWRRAQAKIISLTGRDIVGKLDEMIAKIGA